MAGAHPCFFRLAMSLGRMYKRAGPMLPYEVKGKFAELLHTCRPYFQPGEGPAAAELARARPGVGPVVDLLARLAMQCEQRPLQAAQLPEWPGCPGRSAGQPSPVRIRLGELLEPSAADGGGGGGSGGVPCPCTPPPLLGRPAGTPLKASRSWNARAAVFVPGAVEHVASDGGEDLAPACSAVADALPLRDTSASADEDSSASASSGPCGQEVYAYGDAWPSAAAFAVAGGLRRWLHGTLGGMEALCEVVSEALSILDADGPQYEELADEEFELLRERLCDAVQEMWVSDGVIAIDISTWAGMSLLREPPGVSITGPGWMRPFLRGEILMDDLMQQLLVRATWVWLGKRFDAFPEEVEEVRATVEEEVRHPTSHGVSVASCTQVFDDWVQALGLSRPA
mmetsp:Transcript_75835/g.236064  ORF Transcript_75835/g.236064 Transcript_75835/m.236064 type:complete len:398 (+) Transcript_75835:46-1239(+)